MDNGWNRTARLGAVALLALTAGLGGGNKGAKDRAALLENENVELRTRNRQLATALDSALLHTIAGFEGILCGALAIYTAVAQILNEVYGRTVLPLGEAGAKAKLVAEADKPTAHGVMADPQTA